MSFSPSSSIVVTRSVNARGIADSFEAPEWYLRRFAANIRIRAETVATLTEGFVRGRILDIGCGDGSLSLPLLARSGDITFLDQSAAMLRRVEQRIGQPAPPLVRYINAGLMEAELPPESFDLVLCLGVLAYVRDLSPFLGKVGSVLKPGGRLLLECTEANHVLSRLERAYQSVTALVKGSPFRTHPHGANDVVRTTEAKGLRLETAFRYAYGMPVVSKLLSQPETYKLIRRLYGTVARNRCQRLGNQLIFSFVR